MLELDVDLAVKASIHSIERAMDSMEDSQRRALKPPFQRRNKSVRVVLTSMPKKSRLRRPKLPLFGFMLSGSRGRSAYENRNDQMGSDSKNANEPFQFKSNDTRSLFRRHDLSSTHEKKETNKGRCLAESPVVPNMSESDVSLPDRQNNIDFSKSILVYEANDEEGDSILLEILTESSGTESIPQSVRLQEVLGDSWKAAKYATAPPDGVELSDVSNSSRSSPSSLQSIDSVERGKNPPTQRNNPDPCTQDTVLDCAEYSLKKLSETFWERKSRNYSPQNKNRQTMFNNFCWVHSTWENGNVDDEDEDGMLDTEQSREALRTMLNEAVKEGSSLVSTTLDSLRQVAVDLTEDPVTEDDESQSSNESGKYVSMGEVEMVSSIDNSIDSLEEKLHFDFPEPAELWHPSIDGTGRMFENPINGKAGKSDQGKEEEKWEAFQQMRNSKIALHQDASSAYWPSNVSEDYFQSEEDTSENEDTFSMSERYVVKDLSKMNRVLS